jgi:hypothetical protein
VHRNAEWRAGSAPGHERRPRSGRFVRRCPLCLRHRWGRPNIQREMRRRSAYRATIWVRTVRPPVPDIRMNTSPVHICRRPAPRVGRRGGRPDTGHGIAASVRVAGHVWFFYYHPPPKTEWPMSSPQRLATGRLPMRLRLGTANFPWQFSLVPRSEAGGVRDHAAAQGGSRALRKVRQALGTAQGD